MHIRLRHYENKERFGKDYKRIYDFLRRINQNQYECPNFLWGRWVWMMSRPVDNENLKNRIGIWEDEGNIIAIATFELTFGEIFLCVDHQYEFLKEEVLNYAKNNLIGTQTLKIIIPDSDRHLQDLASHAGFIPTQDKDYISVLDLRHKLGYTLPTGFKIVSMDDGWDFYKYNRIMWRAFNQNSEPSQDEEDIQWRKTMLSSPHINPQLILAVKAPDDTFASHCGLWYTSGDRYAYVEPVATDPEYRKMGLGRSVVYEAVLRAKQLGAKEAIVVSSKQFYYNLGFKPFKTETWWELR